MLTPAVFSFLGILLPLLLFPNHKALSYLLSFALLSVGLFWAYRNNLNSYDLFYNEYHLILKNAQRDRIIPLENIKKLKLTLNEMGIIGIRFCEYKIDFTNERGLGESISFFVSNSSSHFWEFQDSIKLKSPNTKIENFASSWGV